MSIDPAKVLLVDFLKSSWSSVESLVKELVGFTQPPERNVGFYRVRNGQRESLTFDGTHFFLRGSVEYSNPQLTVEEVQGVIAARLLEVTANYFQSYGLHDVTDRDIGELSETLKKPVTGKAVAFLLNTDDVEPDRYSMNPLKESIVTSGQSAFPAAKVKTEHLEIDQRFAQKYDGSLISKAEIELVTRHVRACRSYMDMVDAVKYEQYEKLSEAFGIDMCLPSLRMPVTTLEAEATDGLLHRIVKEVHKDFSSVEQIYGCIGRSMKSRTTLLSVPHSQKGYGSKRAAKGKIYFDGTKLKSLRVDYETTRLYPNAMDSEDVSKAVAEDHFTVDGNKLIDYNFKETPSSPQFFLYSLASPENGVLWHGIGAFGASQLVRSYSTIRSACARGSLLPTLSGEHRIATDIGAQFNLLPGHMWFHPIHRNIDASIGSIQNLEDLTKLGMKLEHLATNDYLRTVELS